MPKTLPAQPHIDWLRKAAKERLGALRVRDPSAKLHHAQFDIAKEYGFTSWRQLKAHIDKEDRKPVFEAARAGDVDTVRRALEAGFDPGVTDHEGRTIHQIAKAGGHEAIELLARQFQERDTSPAEQRHAVNAILDAAHKGRADELGELLDAHADLINARGGNFQKQTALHKAAWQNQHALRAAAAGARRGRPHPRLRRQRLCASLRRRGRRLRDRQDAGRSRLRRRRRGRRPPARRARLGDVTAACARGRGGLSARQRRQARSLVGDCAWSRR